MVVVPGSVPLLNELPPTIPSDGAVITLPEAPVTAVELLEFTSNPQLLLIVLFEAMLSAPLADGLSEYMQLPLELTAATARADTLSELKPATARK